MTIEELQAGQILKVDKTLDWTSFQAVNKLKFLIKREFNLKNIKIGHAGTLDPRATGLLLICTGKATKSISTLQNLSKTYEVEIKIGVQSISYDTEQPEINACDYSHINDAQILSCLETFVGNIEQIPPLFSAIKVDGKRAYDIARNGQEIELKSRNIQILAIENIKIHLPFVRFSVDCSKGTYIRSLAHDIGNKLGVGAYLTQLRRTRIGAFCMDTNTTDFLSKDFSFIDYKSEF